MEKQSKTIKFKVFNVKLLSELRSGEKAYREMFKTFFEADVRINTYSDKFIKFKTMFGIKDSEVIHGELIHYTNIDRDDWYDEIEDKETSVDIPPEKLKSAKMWSYFFIPSIHRFCFLDSADVSAGQIGKFLEEGLKKTLPMNEDIQVNIEISSDGIDEILNAKEVKSLKINLSYSNNDLTKDYAELLDNDMRDADVKDLEVDAKSRRNSTIDLQNSKILKAYLELSKSNGSAKAVIIKDKERVKIETKDYPLCLYVQVEGNDIQKSILDKMRSIFKRSNEEKES